MSIKDIELIVMRVDDFPDEDDGIDCDVAVVDEEVVGVCPLRVKRSVYSTVWTGLNVGMTELFSVVVLVRLDSELNLI
jgi:hypothetical protein